MLYNNKYEENYSARLSILQLIDIYLLQYRRTNCLMQNYVSYRSSDKIVKNKLDITN